MSYTLGSFLEFLPVVDVLTRSNTLSSGRVVSFDVVIPSLPGFAFSSPPPPVWTVNDTARVWNMLMVDVLGYTSGYSVAGTDWVCSAFFPLRCLRSSWPKLATTGRAHQLVSLEWVPSSESCLLQFLCHRSTVSWQPHFRRRTINWLWTFRDGQRKTLLPDRHRLFHGPSDSCNYIWVILRQGYLHFLFLKLAAMDTWTRYGWQSDGSARMGRREISRLWVLRPFTWNEHNINQTKLRPNSSRSLVNSWTTGSDSSLVDVSHILTTVSLYFLTSSFPTSISIYAQNAGFSSSDTRANTNKPFGYGAFLWEGM